MTVTYTDNKIAMLIRERKLLSEGWRNRMKLRPKRRHKERDLSVTGE